jgi:hypothetical protein
MSEADLLTPSPVAKWNPRRRRLFVAVLVLLPLLLLTGIYLTIDYLAERNLREAIAEADRIDPNWRLDDLEASRADYPDDENAALQVIRSVELIPPRWATTPSIIELPLDLLNPHQINAVQEAALREEMAKAALAVAEARKLADLPHGRFPIHYVLYGSFPPLQSNEAGYTARLLWYDALLRAHDGDPDEALRSTRGILNAERSIGDEPTLLSLLNRCNCRAQALQSLERVLSQGEPSAAELAEIQHVLELDEADNLLLQSIRGERASFDRMIEGLQNGSLTTQDVLVAPVPKAGAMVCAVTTAVPGNIKNQRAFAIRYFTQMTEIAQLPTEQRTKRVRELEGESRSHGLLISFLLWSVGQKVAPAYLHIMAQTRCAIVAVAAERYRRAYHRWPASLEALSDEGLLQQVPADPFDGAPLRYRIRDDRVVIYSVAGNLQDNGGLLDDGGTFDQKKGAIRLTDLRFIDLGITLWNVAQRRLLPLPTAESLVAEPMSGEPDADAASPPAPKEPRP